MIMRWHQDRWSSLFCLPEHIRFPLLKICELHTVTQVFQENTYHQKKPLLTEPTHRCLCHTSQAQQLPRGPPCNHRHLQMMTKPLQHEVGPGVSTQSNICLVYVPQVLQEPPSRAILDFREPHFSTQILFLGRSAHQI